MTTDNSAFPFMSNESLREFARFGTDLRTLTSRARWQAIDARKELQRRDDEVTFA